MAVSSYDLSLTLYETLNDPKKHDPFDKFLETIHSDENFKFWKDVSLFYEVEKNDEEKRHVIGSKIFTEFISLNGQKPINIDEPLIWEIENILIQQNKAPERLFDNAKKAVVDLMLKGPFLRFLRSMNYVKILYTYPEGCIRTISEETWGSIKGIMNEEWGHLTKKKDIDVYYQTVSSEGKLRKTSLMGKTIIEESPKNLLRKYFLNTSNRKDWDCSFVSGKVIENIDDNITIIHFNYKISKKNIDQVLFFGWKENDDGSILLMSFNVDHPKVNIPLENQRKESLNYFISPKKLPHNNECSEIMWFVHLDQHTSSLATLKNQLEILYLSRFKLLTKYITKNKGIHKSTSTPEDDSPLESDSEGSYKKLSLFLSPRIYGNSKSPRFHSYLSGDESGPKSAHPIIISVSQVDSDEVSGNFSSSNIITENIQILSKDLKSSISKSKKGKHSSDKKGLKALNVEKRKSTENTNKNKGKFFDRLIRSSISQENSD